MRRQEIHPQCPITNLMPIVESLEQRLFFSSGLPGPTVSITTRYGNELVINATGASDTVSVAQSGSKLTIDADGVTSTVAAPAAGVFVYTRGGHDSLSIGSSVIVQTTIDSIDNAPTIISSFGAHVIAWVDSTDKVTGTASVHAVAQFAGGVSKAPGASLPNPHDAGATIQVKLSLFGTGPVAADVNQGEIGDCYFMASLAAFANQRPQVLRNSAVDLGDGTYAVGFYSKGDPVYVRVNNSFSVGGFKGFKFAYPGADGTIWAMVMEKAFAWFRTGANTYNSISSGWMQDVYADLNVPSSEFAPWMFSDTDLYNMLAADLAKGEAITLASDPSAMDMVSDHTYTLIGVQKSHGVNEYIVRNPWGTSGDTLENSNGIATLTFFQVTENYEEGVVATK
jgi:hypothetical protein